MVTSPHEASHRIFQDRPELLTPVFKVLDIPLPEKGTLDVITFPADATEHRPLVRHVDSVLRVGPSDGEPFLVAVETQLRRESGKESSWPYYVAYLRARYKLPVLLLVVCHDRATAKWASGPHALGARGWVAQRTYPLVVGPDNLPVVTDERTVEENVAMAAFSAMAHSRSPQGLAILEPLARVLAGMDNKKAANYFYDILDQGLGKTRAGAKWREIMSFVSYFPGRGTVRETAYLEGKTEGEAKGEAKGEARGEARGEAKSVLRNLTNRGIPVSEDVRARISSCTDLDLLDTWLDRSVTVTRAEELFADDSESDGTA
ncbi:hypothetical protein AB0I00_37530 [Streptomyces sp. NPDC050803]|uniref:hypothetical protein n=1 Tax=unclassified Streptomyces TaxID=2593676 RepID=UPI00342CCBCB